MNREFRKSWTVRFLGNHKLRGAIAQSAPRDSSRFCQFFAPLTSPSRASTKILALVAAVCGPLHEGLLFNEVEALDSEAENLKPA